MSASEFPLKHVIRGGEVPAEGLRLHFEVDSETRAAIARVLEIPELQALTAELDVTRWRRDGIAVRGRLVARVVQTCVVTLEPVHNAVDVEIEDFYAPGPEDVSGSYTPGDPAAPPEEEIEPLIDHRVDIGGLVVEHLALGLDPYPRCPGVAFDSETHSDDAPGKTGPFAALANWKARNDRK